MKEIQNPILPGFNPDPSIIRVADDYYIATSTFEWYPGVQIHHSKDLINWKLITRPLRRDSLLNMLGEGNSGGIWAPCLSYKNGTYYLIFTDVKGRGTCHNYLVTTEDILGDWSDPIYLDSRGFDPSLFHDDDGKAWYTVMYLDHVAWNTMVRDNSRHEANTTIKRIWDQYKKYDKNTPLFKGILLQEYSEKDKKLIGKPKKIFGNEVGVTEAPHLYKRNGYYYLIVAEGGTSYEHCVTMARSKNIDGPYEVHPQNPILRALGTDAYLQKTGHADFVETQNGDTYMVHLCGRPLDLENRQGCVLGRETGIQKMVWGEDDWLRLEDGSTIGKQFVQAPDLLEFKFPDLPVRDNFESSKLNINFQWLRGDISKEIFSLTDRPGYLRLYGKEMIVSDYILSLVARRQQSFKYTASTAMEFSSDEENQMAGLIVLYSNILYYYLYVGYDEHIGSFISITSNNKGDVNLFVIDPIPVDAGRKIYLKAVVNDNELQFHYGYDEKTYKGIGPILDQSMLSDENSGGFTGAYVGMCCNDPATLNTHADFEFFEYKEN
ncbi:MAG: glycoside hydrolase family 43 protein [Spirochaetaceae bacterium]